MEELKIINITMEEFKEKFNIKNENSLPKSYPVTELAAIMAKGENKNYYLIADKLFEEPSVLENKNSSITENEIKTLEELHDIYRDNLVGYREFLFYSKGDSDSEEAKAIKNEMNNCIDKGKVILNNYNITTLEELKSHTTKFFIPDFINTLLNIDNFNILDEIDCGL